MSDPRVPTPFARHRPCPGPSRPSNAGAIAVKVDAKSPAGVPDAGFRVDVRRPPS